MSTVKITMSYTGGVARGIQMASEFDRLGYLDTLYLPFYSPRHPIIKSLLGLPDDPQSVDVSRVRTNVAFSVSRRLRSARRGIQHTDPRDKFKLDNVLDLSVARRLEGGADFVTAESQIALYTMRRAKELGMRTGIDRTNSHIVYQTELLREEYEKWGAEYEIDERVVNKAEQEYSEANYIFVLSSYVKRTFIERGIPESKLILVPSGIDISDFRQVPKEDDLFRIVYCGLSCFKKGTHLLIEALSELNLPNSELVLIGEVWDEVKPLLARLEGWRALGTVPHKELFKHYSQGSVFVLPSLEEGLAKVTMEAMACGLPVIATTNTGAEDVVREGTDGFIIPIQDKEALKEKILYLYENQGQAREMGRAAAERINESFTLEAYLSRLVAAYDNLL